jgi:hypothetical protein
MEPRIICLVPLSEKSAALVESLSREGHDAYLTHNGVYVMLNPPDATPNATIRVPEELKGCTFYVESGERGGLHDKPTEKNSWATVVCTVDGHATKGTLMPHPEECGTSALFNAAHAIVEVCIHLAGDLAYITRFTAETEHGSVRLVRTEVWTGNPRNSEDCYPTEFHSALDAALQKAICPGCTHSHYNMGLEDPEGLETLGLRELH